MAETIVRTHFDDAKATYLERFELARFREAGDPEAFLEGYGLGLGEASRLPDGSIVDKTSVLGGGRNNADPDFQNGILLGIERWHAEQGDAHGQRVQQRAAQLAGDFNHEGRF